MSAAQCRIGFRTVTVAVVVALAIAGCSSSSKSGSAADAKLVKLDLGAASAAVFAVGGSVGQVYVTGATAGTDLQLVNGDQRVIAHGAADAHGSKIFRAVPVGSGYRVAAGTGAALAASSGVSVTAWTTPPPASFYASQKIGDGYGYIRMRDGITLSMTVHLPGPASKGPYPTVIEYSGYSPADPKSPQPSTLIT